MTLLLFCCIFVAAALQNGEDAGKAEILGARGSCGQDHSRGGVEELDAVMFVDPENVEADLVGCGRTIVRTWRQ